MLPGGTWAPLDTTQLENVTLLWVDRDFIQQRYSIMVLHALTFYINRTFECIAMAHI